MNWPTMIRLKCLALLVFISWLLLDGYIHLLPWSSSNAAKGSVDVFSDGSLPGVRELGILGFRSMGSVAVDVIVLVVHTFNVSNGAIGLGVAELNPIELLLHPLMFATGAAAVGFVNGSKTVYLVVTETSTLFSIGLHGKSIVIVGCGFPGVESIARRLTGLGASLVAYYAGVPTLDEASRLARAVTLLAEKGHLTSHSLARLGFKVIEGAGTRSVPDLGPLLAVAHPAIVTIVLVWCRKLQRRRR